MPSFPFPQKVKNPQTAQLSTPCLEWVLGGMRWKSIVTSSLRRKQTRSALVRDAQGPSLPFPAPRSCIGGERTASGSGWAWTQQIWGFQGGVRWFKESYHFFGRNLWATLKASLNVQFPRDRRLGRHWMITPSLTMRKQRSKINILP